MKNSQNLKIKTNYFTYNYIFDIIQRYKKETNW